ncbi:MAG: Clp protease ClpS [Flammeovirgaceae bacterium]|nr:Clp protease ClpS [Flammeovirgaceae bacterium]MBE62114.1 Clp protease ClpS [Flammeovirgaceae bacterium]MBR07511.1 Clp protease ClpS [Rickettsiales bacterium]HCX24309.1 Clp protease ClpS [Cytophagales bacterium]|tara:strand:- start:2534 stop:2827 length:294 start_codon:yes stop_codon:yes gene_type:complete
MMLEMEFAPDIEELVEIEEDFDQDDLKNLVVHNDNYNTFDHVINTLIKVCKHDTHQAEQCTYIIHYKGKCSVKNGSFTELKPMKDGITDAGIAATIE